jgi:hypothetical protein
VKLFYFINKLFKKTLKKMMAKELFIFNYIKLIFKLFLINNFMFTFKLIIFITKNFIKICLFLYIKNNFLEINGFHK